VQTVLNSDIGIQPLKNKKPVLIQDNYLIYPQAETPDDYIPKQVNCLTKKKIKFSEYYDCCG
jgi:hypothetical protein